MSAVSEKYQVRRRKASSIPILAPAPVALAFAIAAAPLEAAPARSEFSTPHLAIRKGRFFFQRRYPKSFLDAGLFKSPFYRFNLATSDLLEAQLKVTQVKARFDQVMNKLTVRARKRNPNFGVATSAVPLACEVMVCDIEHLASRFQALVLYNDEIDRGEELSDKEFDEYLDEVETERKQLRHANARGNYESHADVIDGFLEAEGLQRPENPINYKSLCRAILMSHLGALTRILERIDGVVVPSPDAPPPVRSDEDYDDLTVAHDYWKRKAEPELKTLLELKPVWRRLQEVTGKTRVSLITRADIVRFQLQEADRINKSTGRRNKPQSVNKKLALVAAVLARVHTDFLKPRGIANPMERLTKLKVHASDVIDKQDLSVEQLLALFSGPVHRRNFRPVGGAGEAAFWMPILGYSLGFRMAELAQLSVNEVLLRDGVWCIWVTTSVVDGEPTTDEMTSSERELQLVNSLKTAQSRRIVPIHPEVLRLGFIEFVQWTRMQGSTQLFRDIRADSKGSMSGNFSAWYLRYLETVKIKRPGVDWVSFRHTFKTACRGIKMPQDLADYLEGHAADRDSQEYGRFMPKTLLDLISVVELPGLKGVPVWTPPRGRAAALISDEASRSLFAQCGLDCVQAVSCGTP